MLIEGRESTCSLAILAPWNRD